MAYRQDEDLEFLGEMQSEDLKDLVELLIRDKCRIPDDWIDTKRYALFMARDVMRALIDQMQSASVPSSS